MRFSHKTYANPQLWGWTSWHAVDTDTKTDSYSDHWVVYLHIYTVCCCFLQISNEIIRLCCRDISLDRIFQGYVISSKQILNDCIQCCLAWKELYLHTSQLHHKYCPSIIISVSLSLSLSLSLSEFCSVPYSTGTHHLELHCDCTVLQQHPSTLQAITQRVTTVSSDIWSAVSFQIQLSFFSDFSQLTLCWVLYCFVSASPLLLPLLPAPLLVQVLLLTKPVIITVADIFATATAVTTSTLI